MVLTFDVHIYLLRRKSKRGEGGEDSEKERGRREVRIQPSSRYPIVPPVTLRAQRQPTGGPEEDIG